MVLNLQKGNIQKHLFMQVKKTMEFVQYVFSQNKLNFKKEMPIFDNQNLCLMIPFS